MGKIVGSDEFTYEMNEEWAKLPQGWAMPTAAVAVDSHDRVFVFNRTQDHPVCVFDREGNFLYAWGGGQDTFRFHHAVYIDPQDNVWLVERDYCTLMKFSPRGKHLMTLGVRGYRSNTGIPDDDFRSDSWKRLTRSAGPFNLPTGIVEAPNGNLFVSDGYANARVHKFTSMGVYITSWGEPGIGPGQLNLPHGVWIDGKGRVLVADRENDRIQLFTQEGEYLAEWKPGMVGPANVCLDAQGIVYVAEHNSGYVSVLSPEGELLARWGSEKYRSMHGIWVDSHRDLYVAQPGDSGGGLGGRKVVKYLRQMP
ncbi:MAG: hypothetical protein HYU30_01640 [Chloroflexi bacterium]|nr:hypothetical protein [Chloroflexota bacterium]